MRSPKMTRREFEKSAACGGAALLLKGLAPLWAEADGPGEPAALEIRGKGAIPAGTPPTLGCWFWNSLDGEPENYQPFLDTAADYEKSLWTHALGGGRINYHPSFPSANARGWSYDVLLEGGLMQGECRVRLLNFISHAPLDCPVAVIFGHAAATNWAGPGQGDTGVSLCDALWKEGYYADLIPSGEIASGALKIAADGHIQYGPQRYSAVVLYQPQYSGPEVAEFFQKAAKTGKTALYRVGGWTMDFGGEPVQSEAALPAQMTSSPDAASAAAAVVERLRRLAENHHLSRKPPPCWHRAIWAPRRHGCNLLK